MTANDDARKSLEGVTPGPWRVDDGRPCETDVFLVALMDQVDDHYDRLDAIRSWLEGDWESATYGTTIACVKGGEG